MSIQPKSSQASKVDSYHIVLPSHANALGTVFGGTVMGWIDIAAAICAQRHSEHVCVTASVDTLNFLAPIRVGDTVHVCARVVWTGRSSMMIEVKVEAEDAIRSSRRVQSVLAYLTFVALDDKNRPTAVPPLKLESAQDESDFRAAAERRKVLLAQRKS